jgi:heme-degrading monooxygenase HmoA
MIIVMFRTYLKPQANLEALGALHQKMHAIVSTMPGFISVKTFTAEDGEVLAMAEFESLESLTAWKEHPEHVLAQQRGREEFFAEYRTQVCSLLREATFTARAETPD